MKPVIGFIGQGFIGKNYADDFEERGYDIVRYALEEPFVQNKEKIKDCEITFIAVPTPSTPKGFNYSIVEEALGLIGDGKIAVIKSTVLPGTTEKLQEKFPNIYLFHSPEFLTAKTASEDARRPDRNIIGYTEKSESRAEEVMLVLPIAPYEKNIPVKEAELVKYGGNIWFYFKVIYVNLLSNLSEKLDIDYDVVKEVMSADRRIGRTHLEASHQGGRGAGGYCFIKDMSAFAEIYRKELPDDDLGNMILEALQEKNIELLLDSDKDLDLLKGVYGETFRVRRKN